MPKQLDIEDALRAFHEANRNTVHPTILHEGIEFPDPTPMAPPVGYKKQPSMVEIVRDMVRSEKLRQEALEAGAETFEDAEDFDVGDDFDPTSPYENDFEPTYAEVKAKITRDRATAKPAEAAKTKPADPPSDGPAPTPPAPKPDAKPLKSD